MLWTALGHNNLGISCFFHLTWWECHFMTSASEGQVFWALEKQTENTRIREQSSFRHGDAAGKTYFQYQFLRWFAFVMYKLYLASNFPNLYKLFNCGTDSVFRHVSKIHLSSILKGRGHHFSILTNILPWIKGCPVHLTFIHTFPTSQFFTMASLYETFTTCRATFRSTVKQTLVN